MPSPRSPRRAAKLARGGDRALLARLLAALEALDLAWDLAPARDAALRAARSLARDAIAAGAELPPGSRDLARRLEAPLERRALVELIVPLERVLDRKRRDEDFLPRSDRAAAPAARMPVWIVADSLRSAFNLGGVFRTAECFGAQEVWLTGYSADPGDPRVARAAMGTAERVTWSRKRGVLDAIAALRAAGSSVLALETGPESTPLHEFQAEFPCALLLGNERFGLAPEALAAAHRRLSIPTFGTKASLNVVAALAIALHAFRVRFGAPSP